MVDDERWTDDGRTPDDWYTLSSSYMYVPGSVEVKTRGITLG